MSNLEFLGICCIACVVPTVILGMIFYIIWAFLFFIFIKKSLGKSKKVVGKFYENVKTILTKLKNKIMDRKFFYRKIAVFTIILLTSIVIQILIEANMLPWHLYVDDLNNISIAIVTIQATLFTLVISLLALVINNDKIYFGFEIKDFYFNHCTVFLKQKTMMYIGIGLILLNTMFLYFDLHNIIYAVFFISLCFIFESARNVMRIFAGTDDVYKKEIEEYIDECLKKDKDVGIICNNIANDWRKKISSQDRSVDDLYHEIYCKIYMHIIRNSR